MAYVTPAQVRDVLNPSGSLTAGTDTAASLTDEELDQAIADAQAQVDAALSSAPTFYQVPLPDQPNTPPLVASVTRDIAAYLATVTWRKGKDIQPQHPVYLRWQRSSAILDQLATGKLDLPGTGATEDYTGSVVNIVPDQWTWYPDVGFGAGQRVPGS